MHSVSTRGVLGNTNVHIFVFNMVYAEAVSNRGRLFLSLVHTANKYDIAFSFYFWTIQQDRQYLRPPLSNLGKAYQNRDKESFYGLTDTAVMHIIMLFIRVRKYLLHNNFFS